jgi:hypothetical protein
MATLKRGAAEALLTPRPPLSEHADVHMAILKLAIIAIALAVLAVAVAEYTLWAFYQ